MREIKFRAWFEKAVEWCDKMFYSEEESSGLGDWFSECEIESRKNNNNVIFMQYTGLKDKNGREIYEGDIVALVYDFGEEELHKSNLGVVTFGEFFAEIYCVVGWYVSRDGEQISESGLDNDFVVFGNIYENPELLE